MELLLDLLDLALQRVYGLLVPACPTGKLLKPNFEFYLSHELPWMVCSSCCSLSLCFCRANSRSWQRSRRCSTYFL